MFKNLRDLLATLLAVVVFLELWFCAIGTLVAQFYSRKQPDSEKPPAS